jgi:spore coat protein CotH
MKRIRTISLVLVVAAMVSWLSRPSLAQAPDPADAFFDDSVLHEIRLSINTKDWQALQDRWQENTYYPAYLRWNDQVVRNIGIRSRGTGSRRPNKLSLRVDMNRYTDGQTFLGLRSFILRNTSQDPSYMRERLAMLFFRRLGIPAVREAHARVFINNQYAGLFTIVESPDTDYLRKSLGENTGRLYEYHFDNEAVNAGAAPFVFQFLGSDPKLYVPVPFQPQTFEDDPQGEVIARWTQAVSDLGNPDWRTNVSSFIDLPGFIRHLAIENFLAEEDGITGDYGPNNFYLYRFTNTTRFQFLPWDKSNAFFDVFFSIFRNIRNGPEDHRNLLAVRALDEPDLLQLYLDTMLECADFATQGAAPDQPGLLEAEVIRQSDQIRAAAIEDTFIFTPDQFEQAVLDLRAFARDRSGFVRAQLVSR